MAATPQVPEESGRSFASIRDAALPYLTSIAPAFASLGAIAYLLGYVVLNVYLGRYGIVSRGPLNIQYFSSGLTLLLLLGLFTFTTGLKIHRMDEEGRRIFAQKPPWATSAVWWLIALICIVSSIAFSITFATVTVLLILLHQSVSLVVAAALVWFLVDYQLAFFRVYRRFPVAGMLFSSVSYVAIVWIAAWRGHDQDFRLFFWSFFGLAMTLVMQLEFIRMFNTGPLARVVTACLILLGIAIAYGERVYERVPQAMGGGRPITVQLLISPQSVNSVQQLVRLNGTLSDDVQLLGDYGDELILVTTAPTGAQRPIRLSKRLIDGIIPRVANPAAVPATPPSVPQASTRPRHMP